MSKEICTFFILINKSKKLTNIKGRDISLVLIQAVLFSVFVIWNWSVTFDYGSWLKSVGLVVSILGASIVIIAILQLNENLSPFPTPKVNGQLITHGLYKYVRHPIYSGIIITMIGFSLFTTSLSRLIITLVTYVFFYIKADYEEKLLANKFPEYPSYKKRTGKIWPILK